MSKFDGGGGLLLFDTEGEPSLFVYGSVRKISVFLFPHLCRYAFSERHRVLQLVASSKFWKLQCT